MVRERIIVGFSILIGYPLINQHSCSWFTKEIHGNTSSSDSFSMAMLAYRVSLVIRIAGFHLGNLL